ncbi:MAG TPA: HU family DNA-binding protein, partial [Candidatus Paceibacterota bacterium]
MNKQALIEKVNEALGGTKASAEKAVDTLIESIID